MYPDTLYQQTGQVLERIKPTGAIDGFYLAGGTGLALQLGHRKSIDLDFFSPEFPKIPLLLEKLKPLAPIVIGQSDGTLDLVIDKVKVTFLSYKYPLLEDTFDFQGVRIAKKLDIGCMKLAAISSRGAKKDFADMYFLIKEYPLADILAAFERKFTGVTYQRLHLLKSLVYFADAEKDPEPEYLQPVSWEQIKRRLEEEAENSLVKMPGEV